LRLLSVQRTGSVFLRALAPYLALLSGVLLFFREVLFLPRKYTIPWDFQYYAFNHVSFLAKSLRAHEFPGWDPSTYAGMPFHANMNAQVWYAPTVLTVLVSNWLGGDRLLFWMAVELASHVLLAGIATFWLLRACGCGRIAATLGGIAFQSGCYFASQTQHFGAITGAVWLPLAILALVKREAGGPRAWTVVLSLSLTAAILAGYPSTIFAVHLGVLLFALSFRNWKLFREYVLATAAAVVLSAVQLIPTVLATARSVSKYRADFRGDPGGLPWEALVSLVWPNWFHILDLQGYRLPYNFTFLYLYCGLIPLGLTLAALGKPRNRFAIPLAALTGVGALLMMGQTTPVGYWLVSRLADVLHDSVYPEFLMLVFSFGIACLAGLGADRLGQRPMLQVGLLLLTALDLIWVGSSRPMNTRALKDEPGVDSRQFDGNVELLNIVRGFASQSNPPSRLDTCEDSMSWAMLASLVGVPSAGGNDPFAPDRYMQVRRIFTGGERWGRYYQVKDLNSPTLDLLNVRYLIARKPLPQNGKWQLAATPPGHLLYENRSALPRFFLVSRTVSVSGVDDAIAHMKDSGFQPGAVALVEGFPSVAYPSGPDGQVRVEAYSPNEAILETESESPRFLVSSEGHYPGWSATINGVPERIVTTDAAFRGLPVPAGRNRIVFRYRPTLLGFFEK
jgi:hypothetical protein